MLKKYINLKLLVSYIFKTASSLNAFAPSPYTVSVGNETKSPYYINFAHFYKLSSLFYNIYAFILL